jgi:uncharacterized protein YkvS
MKLRLLLYILFLPTLLLGEGSNEIYVDKATANTKLYFCNDFAGQCASGGGVRTQFAIYDSNEEDRLCFVTENADEIVYMGFKGDPNNGWGGDYKIVYRIKNSAGTIIVPEADLPTAGTGFINNIGEARIGPIQVAGAGGYDAILFDPPAPGLYYIEFERLDVNTGNRVTGSFYMDLFDITVYNHVASEVKLGRLYSKGWQFIEDNSSGWKLNSSTFYIYSTDSIITSVEFEDMEGRAWIMFCNQYGCQNTGNFMIDRMSLDDQQAYVPEYRIFVNRPDSILYPPASILGQIIPPDPWAEAFCDGTKIFHITVDKPGNVDILLDFDPPFVDFVLSSAVVAGENLIFWDGLDGVGAPVNNNTNIIITITYINGLTNLPLYDIEQNVNGFRIELVALFQVAIHGMSIPMVMKIPSIPGGSRLQAVKHLLLL